MEHGLAKRLLNSSAFVPLTEHEYESVQKARESLLECLFVEEKYDLLVENYLEFEITLLDIAARDMVHHHQDYHLIHRERNMIDRRLANLLSAGRIYIDHTKQHVNRILTKEAGGEFDVSAAFSRQYDSHFGYRCMEALRNHVQHRGFVVHNTRFVKQWINREERKLMLFAISPCLNPGKLRENKEFKKSVLDEMEAQGDEIDLKALVRDYVEGLSKIHSEIRQHLHNFIIEWESVLRDSIARFQSDYPDESIIGLSAVKRDANGLYADEVPIFTEFINQRKYFEKKNQMLTNLTKRFVTSEIIEKGKK